MSSDRPNRQAISLEEATISNMWEIAALVEVLERKGICTKDLYDIIAELRRARPRAKILPPSQYTRLSVSNRKRHSALSGDGNARHASTRGFRNRHLEQLGQ